MTSDAVSAELGYKLTGTVSHVFAMPYGKIIQVGDSVTVRFVYNSALGVSHTSFNCDCLAYEQNHINGFSAKFGSTLFQADSYIIQVANDLTFSGQPPYDAVSVSFDSTLNPPLHAPLLVDGVPYENGLMYFTLAADSELFDRPNLPASLDPNSFAFPSSFNQLDHQPGGFVPVIYTLSSMFPFQVLPSDHDLDDDVDGRDFLIWQRFAGTNGQNGDADLNGIVDSMDLLDWQLNYGSLGGTLTAEYAVPEPSPLTMPIFVLAIVSMVAPRYVVRQLRHSNALVRVF